MHAAEQLDDLLMIPGPTPLPLEVREVLSRPAIGHRSPEFKDVLQRVFPRLQWIFQTQHDVFLYTASGTGAMEAALVNTLNPGDRILALICGVFSQRWADIAETLGLEVERLIVTPGEINTVDALNSYLQASPIPFKAVTFTHSETSTGVLNPIKELATVVKAHGALSIVDAVTSLGAAPFEFDAWGIDLAVSGSQKGFMLPPGLAFLAVSPKAWKAHQQCKNPGYYFNFKKYQKAQQAFTTPYTPATPQILALDVALSMMEAETLTGVLKRHRLLQQQVRAGVQALGLSLFVADGTAASTAVTSVLPPAGITVSQIREGLKKQYGITVADGQNELKSQIFRIGHLGYISSQDVYRVLTALESVLQQLGHLVQPGVAVQVAKQLVTAGEALHA